MKTIVHFHHVQYYAAFQLYLTDSILKITVYGNVDFSKADYPSWAEKSWDWACSVGLIDGQYNVYDGTDDSKGTGCIDVDHD